MYKEGLAIFAWGQLSFPIPPPFYSDPSSVVSGKPVSYHISEVELKAHGMGSNPTPSIPAGRHTFTSSFCLSGNHTIAGGYTPIITSSTCPPASYSYQCSDVRYTVTLSEDSRPSSIISMRPFVISCLPQSNQPRMESSCVRGYSMISFNYNPPSPHSTSS